MVMKLSDLDKEYREMAHFSPSEKIRYCEDLVIRMRGRLSKDYSDTNHMRSLLLEMIEAAQLEIEMLDPERKSMKNNATTTEGSERITEPLFINSSLSPR